MQDRTNKTATKGGPTMQDPASETYLLVALVLSLRIIHLLIRQRR